MDVRDKRLGLEDRESTLNTDKFIGYFLIQTKTFNFLFSFLTDAALGGTFFVLSKKVPKEI